MKKKLEVTRPELNKFFTLYREGRKNAHAHEGYIDYFEARAFLLEALEALEKKHAEEIERIQMLHAQEIEAMAADEAGASY